ncbi:MAG: segregation/condensation protein A [Alphaproteobacteria bacterium]|nr:segregation/condensation protein A [Alphaproteobacteria bacterium]
MNEPEPELNEPDFDAAAIVAPEQALIIALDGFEGPLDLLLALARNQKVDIAKISVLQLADQYLAFIELAGGRNLELAADYLVMAAWLTYFKSRLVLPQMGGAAEPGAEEMAAALRWRLARLQAMREAAVRLMARNRLSRDVFARGAPEPVTIERTRKYGDTLYDLLTAYSQQRVKKLGHRILQMVRAPIYLIEEARHRIERMLGTIPSWSLITRFLPPEWSMGARRRSALASTFLASLELVRDGKLEMRQMAPFGEIFLKDSARAAEERVT